LMSAEAARQENALPGSKFHATLEPSSGKITVVRTPTREGMENSFTFSSSGEMRKVLTLHHENAEVDRMLKDLAHSGSVDFEI